MRMIIEVPLKEYVRRHVFKEGANIYMYQTRVRLLSIRVYTLRALLKGLLTWMIDKQDL